MNERIRELARQADPDYTGNAADDMGHALVGDQAIERFARLIARECAEISENYAGGSMPLSIALAIKEHFGIKGE